jgi:hypothetical protein
MRSVLRISTITTLVALTGLLGCASLPDKLYRQIGDSEIGKINRIGLIQKYGPPQRIDIMEFLNMREGPASTYPINQRLQSGVNGSVLIGKPVFNGAIKWQQVNSRGVIGWMNAYYLVGPEKFSGDSL